MTRSGTERDVLAATARVQPARVRRVFAIAWLIAIAFTSHTWKAVVAYPLALMVALPYAWRGALYESDDRDGAVILASWRPVLDTFVSTVAVLLVFIPWLVFLFVTTLYGQSAGFAIPFYVVLLPCVWLGAAIGFMGQGLSTSMPVGRETPDGPRYQLAALAQRPGTRLSALLLSRRLVASLPAGSVVVAVAADEGLAAGYTALGFTRGRGKRLSMVSGAP